MNDLKSEVKRDEFVSIITADNYNIILIEWKFIGKLWTETRLDIPLMIADVKDRRFMVNVFPRIYNRCSSVEELRTKFTSMRVEQGKDLEAADEEFEEQKIAKADEASLDAFLETLNGHSIKTKGFRELLTNDVLINCFDLGKKCLFVESKDTFVTDKNYAMLKRTYLDYTLGGICSFVPDAARSGKQFMLSLYREDDLHFFLKDLHDYPLTYEGKARNEDMDEAFSFVIRVYLDVKKNSLTVSQYGYPTDKGILILKEDVLATIEYSPGQALIATSMKILMAKDGKISRLLNVYGNESDYLTDHTIIAGKTWRIMKHFALLSSYKQQDWYQSLSASEQNVLEALRNA